MINRSPLFYVGDKFKLLTQILPLFPTNINKFIEPFIGGGSVFLNVTAKQYLLNDIDKNLYLLHSFFINNSNNKENVLKDMLKLIDSYNLSISAYKDSVPLELKQKYKKTYYSKYNKNNYEKLRNDFNKEDLKDPLKLYLLVIYGFNRMIRFNSKNEFNVPVGNVDFNKNVISALNNYFTIVRNANISLFKKDYIEFIKQIDFENNDFVYFDPPYLITSSEYNKLWSEQDEINFLLLLDELNKKKIRFAVSNVTHFKKKTNEFFIEWSNKYKLYEINSNYISYHDNSQKEIREVLITNY